MRRGAAAYAHDVSARRGQIGSRQLKQLSASVKVLAGRLSVALLVLIICSTSLLFRMREDKVVDQSQIDVDKLWTSSPSNGWRPSSVPRSQWPSPPDESNGYLLVRCNGGLNQQRSAATNSQSIIVINKLSTRVQRCGKLNDGC